MTDSEIREIAVQDTRRYQFVNKVKLTPTRFENRVANYIKGFRKGRADGMKAERERGAAILALSEAKHRQDTALHIALNTRMTVEQAKSFLATIPETPGADLPFSSVAQTDASSDALANVNRVMAAAGFKPSA